MRSIAPTAVIGFVIEARAENSVPLDRLLGVVAHRTNRVCVLTAAVVNQHHKTGHCTAINVTLHDLTYPSHAR